MWHVSPRLWLYHHWIRFAATSEARRRKAYSQNSGLQAWLLCHAYRAIALFSLNDSPTFTERLFKDQEQPAPELNERSKAGVAASEPHLITNRWVLCLEWSHTAGLAEVSWPIACIRSAEIMQYTNNRRGSDEFYHPPQEDWQPSCPVVGNDLTAASPWRYPQGASGRLSAGGTSWQGHKKEPKGPTL